MGLNIQPSDSAGVFTYEITYGEGEAAQVRPYVPKRSMRPRGITGWTRQTPSCSTPIG
ncbi:MAG: hypothetical protein IPG32_00525 [Saprospirales bacterium]|nr:hypothetical protein [Saprospirales bacterium]